MNISEAMAVIKQHMNEDLEYAWAWQCNLAMSFKDASNCSHQTANEAAANFMKLCWGVDITSHLNYQSFISEWNDYGSSVQNNS